MELGDNDNRAAGYVQCIMDPNDCHTCAGTTSQERLLSDAERNRLAEQDKKLVSEFRRRKLDVESQKMWDLFYKRNKTNFFKDRHWTTREFEQLRELTTSTSRPVLLEAGCGVGNFIFPLLQEFPNLFIYACDFSPRAVEYVKSHDNYVTTSCSAFQCDLTMEACFENHVTNCSVDVVSLIFVLSAICPEKFINVFTNCFNVLKPGGHLIFRDYGINDYAMIRFSSGNKISENFYARQDGTRAYYFTTGLINDLVSSAGFRVISNEYVLRETVNKKEGLSVPRVFVQGKFMKPE